MAQTFTERDPFSPITYSYLMEEVLYQGRSQHQDILVFKSPFFGRVLVLDGVVQLTEWDEYYYHEMLAHVPLHAHPHPRRVLIIGGGDGGALREVLKHPGVEEVTLVEVDAQVVEVSRRFFPTLATGFADPRTRLIIAEGSAFLAGAPALFDVILVDSTDPVGLAANLFTQSFYQRAAQALTPEGMLTSQTESLHFHRDFVRQVQGRLAQVFPIVGLYAVPLATYAGNWWTFSIASRRHPVSQAIRAPQGVTRYYSAEVHRHAFLPPSLREELMKG